MERSDLWPKAEFIAGCIFFCQRIVLSFAYFLLCIFEDLKIDGRENARNIKAGPLIIIANHKSFLDPLIIGLCFPFFSRIYPLRFIAKDTFFKNPIGWIFYKSVGAFPAAKGKDWRHPYKNLPKS